MCNQTGAHFEGPTGTRVMPSLTPLMREGKCFVQALRYLHRPKIGPGLLQIPGN